jgi:putative hydrolase of the HAD superfamily
MALADLSATVVVLDLDDTLYPEADYQESGLHAVCAGVESLYGKSVAGDVDQARARGEKDLLAVICRAVGLPQEAKDSLLWMYRLHSPCITLRQRVRQVVNELELRSSAVVILTDGRSVTQRLKLKALELSHLRAYISEECGSVKPDAARFHKIMSDLPAGSYVYVADNPAKDFLAPNALHWRTIGVRGNTRNIHPQDCAGRADECMPQQWINGIEQLLESLC